jgi:hypothetical protein
MRLLFFSIHPALHAQHLHRCEKLIADGYFFGAGGKCHFLFALIINEFYAEGVFVYASLIWGIAS